MIPPAATHWQRTVCWSRSATYISARQFKPYVSKPCLLDVGKTFLFMVDVKCGYLRHVNGSEIKACDVADMSG